MKLNPTLDKIVVKKCNFDEIYKSSIVLVESSKDSINKLIYEVVETGPGGMVAGNEVVMTVKPGDKVIIPEFIGSEINMDNEQYRIIRLQDILATVEKGKGEVLEINLLYYIFVTIKEKLFTNIKLCVIIINVKSNKQNFKHKGDIKMTHAEILKRRKRRRQIRHRRIMFSLLSLSLMLCVSIIGFSKLIHVIYNNVISYETSIVNNTDPQIYSLTTTIAYAKDKPTEMDIKRYPEKPELLKQEYYEYIIKMAEQEKISVESLLAIITTENELYDTEILNENTNGTYDIGLCQINSKYIDYFGEKYNIDNFDPLSAYDSIEFLAKHFKYLATYGIDNYNLSEEDSYLFAAGAYNRGLSNECKYRNMYDYKEKFLNNYNLFLRK